MYLYMYTCKHTLLHDSSNWVLINQLINQLTTPTCTGFNSLLNWHITSSPSFPPLRGLANTTRGRQSAISGGFIAVTTSFFFPLHPSSLTVTLVGGMMICRSGPKVQFSSSNFGFSLTQYSWTVLWHHRQRKSANSGLSPQGEKHL